MKEQEIYRLGGLAESVGAVNRVKILAELQLFFCRDKKIIDAALDLVARNVFLFEEIASSGIGFHVRWVGIYQVVFVLRLMFPYVAVYSRKSLG